MGFGLLLSSLKDGIVCILPLAPPAFIKVVLPLHLPPYRELGIYTWKTCVQIVLMDSK